MLSVTAYEKLTKTETYKLYTELYKKLEEKGVIITDFIKDMRNNWKNTTEPVKETRLAPATNFNKVREFNEIPIREEANNLVMGSSIVRRLATDRSIPADVQILAYSGSTTKEKMKIIDNYEEKNIKTFLLQDGTNAILKQTACMTDELIDDYSQLITKVQEKFKPETLLLMEVLPLKDEGKNKNSNQRIDQFNSKLKELADNSEYNNIKVIPANELVKRSGSYNQLFYDDIHLNFNKGVPFLKNIILSHLLQTSNGMVSSVPGPKRLQQQRSQYNSYHNQYRQQRYYY